MKLPSQKLMGSAEPMEPILTPPLLLYRLFTVKTLLLSFASHFTVITDVSQFFHPCWVGKKRGGRGHEVKLGFQMKPETAKPK